MKNIDQAFHLFNLDPKYCALCQKTDELVESHVIPSFIVKWIKKTSATGFLRYGFNPNARIQDGLKRNLLCKSCEQTFSAWERLFSLKIFYPYVNKELSEEGVAQSKVATIEYDSWLLNFTISLQWRCMLFTAPDEEMSSKFRNAIVDTMKIWRDFLLKNRSNSGSSRHYLVFLQNLASGIGKLPPHLPPNCNTYLLRALDTTPVVKGSTELWQFTKLGPMFIATGIMPSKISKMASCQIRMKGTFPTATSINNPELGSFVLINRPREVGSHMAQEKKVKDRILKSIKANPERVQKSLTAIAQRGDILIQKRIKRR